MIKEYIELSWKLFLLEFEFLLKFWWLYLIIILIMALSGFPFYRRLRKKRNEHKEEYESMRKKIKEGKK